MTGVGRRAGPLAARSVGIAALLVVLVATPAFAQTRDEWRTFTTAHGLAHNVVNTILETRDGAVWFGTESGASKLVGMSWTTYRADPAGLVNDRILMMHEAADGAVWFGTYGGVTRFQDGTWMHHDVSTDPPFNRVVCALEREDGGIWFGCDGAGAVHFEDGVWTRGQTAHHIVRAIVADQAGDLWFAGRTAVSRLRDTTWTHYGIAQGLVHASVNTMIVARDGARWIATDGGVSRFAGTTWTNYTTGSGLISNRVRDVLESRDGSLWLATDRGVSRFRNGTWKSYDADSGLAGNDVVTIFEASDASLWFGTQTGLSRFRDETWKTFRTADGLGDDRIRTIFEARDGSLWFGTSGGVSQLEDDVWTRHSTASGMVHDHVQALLRSADGTYWIGTKIGLSRLHSGSWTNHVVGPELPNSEVNALLEARDGTVWVGTHYNASRYRGGAWEVIDVGDRGDIPSHSVNAMLQARDGAIWFATDQGASRLSGDTLTRLQFGSGATARDRSQAIVETPDGAIWIGTRDGVIRLANGRDSLLTTADGLASDVVTSAAVTADGAIWFGTDGGGVSRLHHGRWTTYDVGRTGRGLADDHVLAVYASPSGPVWIGTTGGVSRFDGRAWSVYTTADGLHDNHVHAILEAPDGAMWFGTESGVSRMKPDRVGPVTTIVEPPDTLIGTATVFVRSFLGSDLRTPQEDLTYSWTVFLEGEPNPVWTPFDRATYAVRESLANGHYVFRVRARDAWGNVDAGPPECRFRVDVTPPTVTIDSPAVGDTVSGNVVILGNAYDTSDDFDSFDMESGRGDRWALTEDRRTIAVHDAPDSGVVNDTLAIWSTGDLGNGAHTLRLRGHDRLGHRSEVFLTVIVAEAAEDVEASLGTRLSLEGVLDLDVPPRALPRDEQIVVMLCSADSTPPTGLVYAETCFNIQAGGTPTLLKPATLSVAYAEQYSGDATRLSLYRSPTSAGPWTRLGGTVDANARRITTRIRDLGFFAVFEDNTAAIGSGISDVTIQPRVLARSGPNRRSHVEIAFVLERASPGTVKIYNRAGRITVTLKDGEPLNRGVNVVSWNGNDRDGQTCRAGLYVVSIEANGKKEQQTLVITP